jgi:DUF2971 family protein
MHWRAEPKDAATRKLWRARLALMDMRLYYFTPLQCGRSNLQNTRIKVSRINELNDPYELLGVDLSDVRLREGYIAMREEFDRRRGVICFSRSWSAPIMRSHYADRRRGVCLGFDVSAGDIFEVGYAEKRVPFTEDMLRHHELEKHMHRLLGTKHSLWKYENEVRVFCGLQKEDAGLFFRSFGEGLELREVVLGVRCEEATLKELTELAACIAETRIEVRATRLSDTAFEIVKA